MNATTSNTTHTPWNKGKLIGQKAPLKLKDIWGVESMKIRGRWTESDRQAPSYRRPGLPENTVFR